MTTVYGITGGVGMGKSTVAQLLLERGIPVVDSDQLARDVVMAGAPALEEIRQTFGNGFITAAGQLDRPKMAQHVFAHPQARQKLEAIIHPRVRSLWLAQIKQWRATQVPRAAVVIPLLYEVQAESQMDHIICVACTEATQHARLHARGWTAEQIEQRIAAQMSVAEKMAQADTVLWTEGDLEALRAQLLLLLDDSCRAV